MANKLLQDELALTGSLYELVATYEEIAVSRMQRIRESVLRTRTFIDGLASVFQDVEASRSARLSEILAARRPGSLLRRVSKGSSERALLKSWRTPLLVLLTTDVPLAGPVVRRVFRRFLAAVDTEQADVLVAGRVGRDLLKEARPELKFSYVDLPDRALTEADVRPLRELVLSHRTARIFYSRFNSMLEQVVTDVDLSDPKRIAAAVGGARGRHPQFLFEPELPVVVAFFETQILGALATQAIHESQLAMLGSRVTTMEEMSQNVQSRLDVLKVRERVERKAEQNKEQRELMAGVVLWGG